MRCKRRLALLAIHDGKPNVALLRALSDAHATVRATAAEAWPKAAAQADGRRFANCSAMTLPWFACVSRWPSADAATGTVCRC